MNFELHPETGCFVREYITDDGVPGIHLISREVLASRMVLLGIDDPVQALGAMVSEMELPQEVEPYTPVLGAIGQAAAVDRMRRESMLQGLGDPLAESAPPAPRPMMRTMSLRPQTMAARILSGDPAVEQEYEEAPQTVSEQAAPIPLLTPDTLHEIPVIAEAQAEARTLVPVPTGPRTESQEEFAEMVRAAFGDELDQMRREMVEQMRNS